ncbi:helix-turn-helix domain-containing protein [Aciditerrimonas ferrireducens]|jgi:DNA-binding MarR family transcriptional regulator|nr:helix-turn-helix domain-containing protein [Aciditerrimonas ferrireducens]
MALLDGRPKPAGVLAAEAGVAPSTMSGHLARLVAGGLVTVRREGRQRVYGLARPEVAQALEALARVAPRQSVRSLRQGTYAEALRRARTCYDHLAGRLGVALLDGLLARGLLEEESGDACLGGPPSRSYRLTPSGRAALACVGVDLSSSGRRPLVRPCVDWSERRPHLAGALGARLLRRLLELGWLRLGERRIVLVTASGRTALEEVLGVDPASWDLALLPPGAGLDRAQ